MHFNTLDFIILGILFLSVIIGLIRGFVREAISLATWFCAVIAALKFSPWVSELLHSAISHTMTRYIVSGFLIFVAVLIVGAIVSKLVHLLISVTGFGLLDRLLGFIFGAARGILSGVVVLLLIGASPYKNAEWMQQSALAPHFQPIVTYFVPMLPKDLSSMAALVNRINAKNTALSVMVA
jgi:membrane protein required for colicin V production